MLFPPFLTGFEGLRSGFCRAECCCTSAALKGFAADLSGIEGLRSGFVGLFKRLRRGFCRRIFVGLRCKNQIRNKHKGSWIRCRVFERRAGFDAVSLKQAGFAVRSLKDAGFDAKTWQPAAFDDGSLVHIGFDARSLKEAGVDAGLLKEAEFGAVLSKEAGFDNGSLLAGSRIRCRVFKSKLESISCLRMRLEAMTSL